MQGQALELEDVVIESARLRLLPASGDLLEYRIYRDALAARRGEAPA